MVRGRNYRNRRSSFLGLRVEFVGLRSPPSDRLQHREDHKRWDNDAENEPGNASHGTSFMLDLISPESSIASPLEGNYDPAAEQILINLHSDPQACES
jgi:hypothetical protein